LNNIEKNMHGKLCVEKRTPGRKNHRLETYTALKRKNPRKRKKCRDAIRGESAVNENVAERVRRRNVTYRRSYAKEPEKMSGKDKRICQRGTKENHKEQTKFGETKTSKKLQKEVSGVANDQEPTGGP